MPFNKSSSLQELNKQIYNSYIAQMNAKSLTIAFKFLVYQKAAVSWLYNNITYISPPLPPLYVCIHVCVYVLSSSPRLHFGFSAKASRFSLVATGLYPSMHLWKCKTFHLYVRTELHRPVNIQYPPLVVSRGLCRHFSREFSRRDVAGGLRA